MSRRRWRVVGLVLGAATLAVLMALALVLLAGSLAFLTALGEPQHELSPAEVESVARIRLPPSTAGLRSRRVGFQDDLVHVRFTLSTEDATVLAASSCVLGPETAGPPDLLAISEPWWDAQRVRRHRICTKTGIDFTQVVAVDSSGLQRWTAYVVLMER